MNAQLQEYDAIIKPISSSTQMIRLIDSDPDAAVAKVRKVGEYVAKRICLHTIVDYDNRWSFAQITKELYGQQVIGKKAKGYIDHVRTLGNQAAHADISDTTGFNHSDAIHACYALVLFLKEVKANGLI
ncbi:DUF4145 domain-containing protein [Chloroflexi bacterium TSY]|nr:DUF4145 domain-containing protein [Chloroflexi bacterium TSY]